MLKIFDSKDQVPETVLEHYAQRADGKWEPQIEGINSLGGLITKRDELLAKVKEIPTLKARLGELEGQETLPAGKVAVDKSEFEKLKTEHAAFTALGTVDEIKPKVEGYETLKQKDEARAKEEQYRAAAKASGYDEAKFISLANIDKIETVAKTVNENGKAVDKYFVKSQDGTETAIADYVTQSPTFAPFADSLTATGINPTQGGTKIIRQGSSTPATPTIETEKAARISSGIYGL